ncbi:MAG: putative zinc-binding metallopeptidase, partial [Burkholderiales bacterium]
FPDNGELWGRIERSKRRLVSALIALGLPVASRVSEDTERGLMFDLLRGSQGTGSIMTGHEDGLITINIEEADHAVREAARKAMHEPYRTLLGHFRHEVGHYYWDRLVDGTDWLEPYRELFGDERGDYAQALERHYEQGPPADWQSHFVSAYATSHPWEDWAECWAHYLHMRDTVDTALNFALDIESPQVDITAFEADALWSPEDPDAARFLKLVNGWTRLNTMLNEMSRSMGQPDFYPFVLTRDVVAKLQFIHLVVGEGRPAATGASRTNDAQPEPSPSPAATAALSDTAPPALDPPSSVVKVAP